jgi:hypothetical protein
MIRFKVGYIYIYIDGNPFVIIREFVAGKTQCRTEARDTSLMRGREMSTLATPVPKKHLALSL